MNECRYDEVVCYETIKRESKIKPNSECRCDEKLKTKVEVSTRLSDTQVNQFILQLNKKRRRPKGKSVTLKL